MPISARRLKTRRETEIQAGAALSHWLRKDPTNKIKKQPDITIEDRSQENRVTGPTKPLKIMHWNAEGVNSKRDGYSKKLELENILHEEQVNICCFQETHLNKDIAFKVRGYKCFRLDRLGKQKGGILTLVKNNITA